MKNVLVTGSTGTLGEEILRLLLKNNYNVIGHYNKNWERANELEKELGIEFIKCDLTNENDIDNMVNYLINKYEHIDILINNAAFYYDEPLEEKTKATTIPIVPKLIASNTPIIFSTMPSPYSALETNSYPLNFSAVFDKFLTSSTVTVILSRSGLVSK